MPSLEGIIILSPSGEPILTSQYTHPLDNYPLLHVDQLTARLSIHGEADDASQAYRNLARIGLQSQDTDKDWGFVRWSDDGLPVGLTEGIPKVDRQDEQDEVESVESTSDASDMQPSSSDSSSVHTDETTWAAGIVHLEHNGLRFIATMSRKTNPLLPVALLRVLISNLERYLGAPLVEEAIRDNFDTVYQLLEEMLDESGQPLHTEYNTLRELVHEPNWIDDLVSRASAVSGLSNTALGNAVAAPSLPAIPWRRPANLMRPRNEAYFDVTDTITGVFRAAKEQVALGSLHVQARIDGSCRLSGTPDLLLRLSAAEKHIIDASLHPCVRLRAWKRERALSFVPPEGDFELATFMMQSTEATSRYVPVRLDVSRRETLPGDDEDTTFHIRVSCTRPMEDLEISFSVDNRNSTIETTLSGGTRPGVASEDLNAVRGTFQYAAKSGQARWNIRRFSNEQRPLELRGTIKSESAIRLSTAVTCRFTIPNHSLTGLKVTSIDLVNDAQYKPYKGVRSVVRGDLDWRW